MPNEPKQLSEQARMPAAGKIREGLIKRREAYFDLLVSGFGVEQVTSDIRKTSAAVRRLIGQALPQRQLDAACPDSFAGVTVTGMFEDEKGCTKELKRLKSLARVTLCAGWRARYSPSSSSSSASPIRSTETTRSCSSVSNTITPCVARPAMRMPATGILMS